MSTDDNAQQVPRFIETENDRFEILGQLGRGGMGVVYKAYQIKMDRVVALKLISVPHNTKADTLIRFQREAAACGRVNHPAVLKVFAVDVYESTPLIVMEFVEGKPLAALLEQAGTIAQNDLIRLTSNLLDGLEAVHAAGFVHRDIKPHNIIVTADGSAKLMDFGIAKMLDTTGTSDYQRLTQTGMVLGSPMYMSPEQCAGSSVDFRSDIYSLGCTLYEAISGMAPFQGQSSFELLFQHLEQEPPPLPDTVHRDLADIILKSISKRPEDRFQSAREFKQALSDFSNGTYERTGKPQSARPRPKITAKFAALLCAALVVPSVVAALMINAMYHPTDVQREMTATDARALINKAGTLRKEIDDNPQLSREQKLVQYKELANNMEIALSLLGESELDRKFHGTESLAQILERFDTDKAAKTWLDTAKLADLRFADKMSAKKRLEYYDRAIRFLQHNKRNDDALKLISRLKELQMERGAPP